MRSVLILKRLIKITLFVLIFVIVPVSLVFADGEAGSAMFFDGLDDYVLLDETNIVMGGTAWKNSKTVSMWVKPEGIAAVCVPNPSNCDAVFGDRPRWWGISRGNINGEDRLWIWNYDTDVDSVSIRYTAGEWVHITLVHDGGVLSAYKNGQFVGSVNSGTTTQPFTGGLPVLEIGGVFIDISDAWLFEGEIDEVRLYNRALTQTEIQNTMFEPLVGNESGLTAYYTMNTLDGGFLPDELVDEIGDPVLNPNNGILYGEPQLPYLLSSTAFDKPVTSDQTLSTNEDTSIPVSLVAVDKQGDPLTYEIVSGPAHGILSGSAPDYDYIPAENYYGEDSFTYQVSDATHTSAPGLINITVNSVNDPPVADSKTLTTPTNTNVSFSLSGSDVDSLTLTFHFLSMPSHGSLTGSMPNYTYHPFTDFEGVDSFTYRARDGSNTYSEAATITITVGGDVPPPVNYDHQVYIPLILR